MDKRLLAITVALFASISLSFGAGSPYTVNFNGVGTNTFLTNPVIRTPLFGLTTNLGTTEATIVLNGTNTSTASGTISGKHVQVTQSSTIMTSSDGAFSPLTLANAMGADIEIGANQFAIIEVIDANNAIVGLRSLGGYLSIPSANIASTTGWLMRPVVLRTTDNVVGLERYGLRVDCDGMLWQSSLGSQSGISFGGVSGGSSMFLGVLNPQAVTTLGTVGVGISTLRTNASDWPAGKIGQFYVSDVAGPETFVANGGKGSGISTEIALQGPLVNLHGTTVSVSPALQLTNSVASYLSNKLSLVVIGTSIAATNGGFNWTNNTGRNIDVFVDNAGVTASSLKINGTAIYTSANGNWTIPLQDQEWLSELYSAGTPTLKYKPF